MAQDNDKKLYKIVNRLGTFYIVAETFDGAAGTLRQRLDEADYGFFQLREIPAIEHVATQSFHYDGIKQSFDSNKPNLLIAGYTLADIHHFAEQMAAKCEECEKLKHDKDEAEADLANANEQLLEMQADMVRQTEHFEKEMEDARQVFDKERGGLKDEIHSLLAEINRLKALLPPAPADSNPKGDTSTKDDNQPGQPDSDNHAPQQSVKVDWSRYKRKFRAGDIICRKDGTTQEPLTIDRLDTDNGYYICTDGQVICFPDQLEYVLVTREYMLESKEAKED